MTTAIEPNKPPVLVAVDFSSESHAAVAWAAHQAQIQDAPLVILHVVYDPPDDPGFYASTSGTLTPIIDVAERKMREFLAESRKNNPELTALATAETELVEGLPAGRIVEVADRRDALMVVIGNVGYSAVKSILLGSEAENVLRTCARPVVVIRSPG